MTKLCPSTLSVSHTTSHEENAKRRIYPMKQTCLMGCLITTFPRKEKALETRGENITATSTT